MAKQQTAVEWLLNTMANSASMNQPEIDKVFEQAKQLERQHIIDAYNNASFYFMFNDAEEYYNETFNQ